jgi:HK97 family phage portal protein
MGLISSLRGKEQRKNLQTFDTFLDWLIGGRSTATGIFVNEKTSMECLAVYACVKILSESVGFLPLVEYKRLPNNGRERATNHWLYPILHDQPNPEMTSMEFRETEMGHLGLWGNAYSEIERDKTGKIKALWPLRPDRMEVKRRESTNEIVYLYEISVDKPKKLFEAYQICHKRGLSGDGLIGYSPIRQLKESIALTMATEEFGARLFSNDSRPGGVLEHPGKLGDDAYKRIKKDWEAMHAGLENAHRVAILEEGLSWKQVGIPPDDAQFLQTRKFQLNEIARLYRIPPHMLADLERATFSNIEHQGIDFVVYSLSPWLVRIEQRIQIDLLSEPERKVYFVEHLINALLRGDVKSRYEAYAIGRQWGWLSANDVLSLENRNPIDEGDTYLIPFNMMPVGGNGQTASPSEPEPEPRRVPNFNAKRIEWRSMDERIRVRSDFKPLIQEAAQRLVRKEILMIRNLINKSLKKGKVDEFREQIDELYENFPKDSERILAPTLLTYAGQIQAVSQAELESSKASRRASPVYCTCEEHDVSLEELMGHYQRDLDKRHISLSKGTIMTILDRIIGRTAQTEIDDVIKELDSLLDDWDLKGPPKIAVKQVVKVDGLIARSTFIAEGSTTIKWVAAEGASIFCKAMDGKKVSANEPFLEAGETFQPEGADTPLVANNIRYHPPLVPGCECFIGPG